MGSLNFWLDREAVISHSMSLMVSENSQADKKSQKLSITSLLVFNTVQINQNVEFAVTF